MSLWIVVPIRSLKGGKSRLAAVLNADERTALVERLLHRTLDRAADAVGLDRTLVVSTCHDVRELAEHRGAQVLEEAEPRGLNEALRQAQLALAERGATEMLIVSGDLPGLEIDDLQRCAAATSTRSVALAPDRSGSGTNAIGMPVNAEFEFAFGPDSLSRHRANAERIGLQAVIVETLGLGFDVDLPDDLARLHAAGW